MNTDRAEPPMSIPRGWGRKGSGPKDWLSRINTREVLGAEEDTDWILGAAEVPLPSVEERPRPHTPTSRASKPTSIPRRNGALDKLRQWEMDEDDFTGRSLQISNSPPISIKNTTLDRIREREIEVLERRAVTTSRLGELKEKTSIEQLRRRSVSAPADEPQDSPERSKDRTERKLSISPENQHNKRPTILEDEGEQVPNTPVTIYRGRKTGSEGSSDRPRTHDGHLNEIKRPSHERQDSHRLLRELARASSASASPSPAKDFRDKHDQPPSKTENQEMAVADPESEDDDPHGEENDANEIRTTEGSDRTSDQTPTREPEDKNDATPQAFQQALPSKTPLVTGAWVDTPLPNGGRGPPFPNPADLEDVRDLTFGVDEEISRLNIRSITDRDNRSRSRGRTAKSNKNPPNGNKRAKGKSALTTIVDEAKRGVRQGDDDDSPLGDDTIRSLEDILADDTDVCTLLKLDEDVSKSLQLQTSASSKPLTQNERDRQTEIVALERMNGRLRALGLSIHDAKRGISKLAAQVCNEGGEFHDFIWPCEKCGCPAGGRNNDALLRAVRAAGLGDDAEAGWQISIPVPRLWTWRKGDRRPKLTWLGLFTLLAWVWVITEYLVCSVYCHPRYASSMVDFGVDITAPRAPFAAVTMFWRSPFGMVFRPFWYLLSLLVRFIARVLGYLDGFAAGGGGGGGGGGRGGWAGGWRGAHAVPRLPVSRDARIPRPVWGPDLSMMSDEYI